MVTRIDVILSSHENMAYPPDIPPSTLGMVTVIATTASPVKFANKSTFYYGLKVLQIMV